MAKETSASEHEPTGTQARTYTLPQVFETAVAHGAAVAVWRLPLTTEVHLCLSFQTSYSLDHPVVEGSPAGFLFCPFHPNETHRNIFIHADLYFNFSTGAVELGPQAPPEALAFLNRLQEREPEKGRWHTPLRLPQNLQQTQEAFTNAVTEAVQSINSEAMEKVVLSRTQNVPLPQTFALAPAFEQMLEVYPNAFVTLVSVPEAGTWMGASPEILVTIDRNNIFKTVALAGTQPATADGCTSSAIWRQKEIEEQAMVERYILSCFKKIRLREYSEIGPRTVIAGNLMHLRTDFKVDMKEVDYPTLGTDMLELLHPTSAVCGLPKEPALKFILAREGYERSYYSGFLGPVNSPLGTHLYVNLRCMQILEAEAVLYAGAGITAESLPEKEWLETQHKMQTMRRVLSNFE